ncbi:hypothetical protein [Xenorhabdus bovienii]|uniref:hypothetical protein n=1 Tax=Xenorhabdus bovienii TaxID=40576 RepID=UPI001F5B0FA4|nr:hypothetical protein [Xenorhabdus bovienii]
MTNALLSGTDPLLKFLRPALFLKIKSQGRQKIMARAPKPPTYLNEIAASQWKSKAKILDGVVINKFM